MKPYYEHAGITIYHGDCREVLANLPRVDLVLTDPPYGIDLSNHDTTGATSRTRVGDYHLAGDSDTKTGQYVIDWAEGEGLPIVTFASPLKPWAGKWRQYLVWDKGPAVGGGGDTAKCWKPTWELIQVARTPVLNGSRDSAVLRYWIAQDDYQFHPTQKPSHLLTYLVSKCSAFDCLILDPFMGSGSTLKVAKDMRRNAIGIEIEERYCEIAARRMSQEVMDFGGEASMAVPS